ncbi:MAG: S-ribosylhomocysteine lyase [Bacteroides sp.]|nr:S-ribosylhomocysteine lyase [Bacteroides sp.]MCM1379647.1 S-ribosylhomocysteine lyase [Bacteroides sp.]MCM1445971.1 S-ribosylhomocysteine lyase [Prevotella sp.]
MKKIPSFTIDHLRLKRGIFVSRRDTTPSGDVLTTFDIRLTEPNRQPAANPKTLHTIEHLAATYLRNDPQWQSRVVYWGPMGCCTGSYLILQGELEPQDILPLMRLLFEFIADFNGEIPGATPRDCGNYTFNDLPAARALARQYLTEVLAAPAADNLTYPAE